MNTTLTSVTHDHADDETWERLARHLTGESTPEESAAVGAWAAADPERARLLESAARALDAARAGLAGAPGAPDARVSPDAAWPAVDARLGRPALVGAAPADAPRLRAWRRFPRPSAGATGWRRTAGLAAAAGLFAVAAGAFVVLRRPASEPRVAPTHARPQIPREYATRPGQRSLVRLADGTRVTLAPGSILRLRAGLFGDSASAGPREVALEGEAFFDVPHDAERPFVVRGAAGVVRDLGTSFSVRSYGVERSLRVAVTEGLVSLRALSPQPGDTLGVIGIRDSLVLRAGEVAEVTPGGLPARLPKGAATPLLSWTRDTLVFAGTPLSRVAAELERWYAVRVSVPDTALARERLTATVPRGELDAALEIVTLALGVRAQREGNRVVLRRP